MVAALISAFWVDWIAPLAKGVVEAAGDAEAEIARTLDTPVGIAATLP